MNNTDARLAREASAGRGCHTMWCIKILVFQMFSNVMGALILSNLNMLKS